MLSEEAKKLIDQGDVYDSVLVGKDWQIKVYKENAGIRLLGRFDNEGLSSKDWDYINDNLKGYNRNPINPNKF